MKRLFVDTGAWFAYANRRDDDHDRVRAVLREHKGRLLSSNFVFDETITLGVSRVSHAFGASLGVALLDPGVVELVRVSPDDERRAWELFLKRDDREYSFTDCTSFVLMRRLGLDTAATVDDDFRSEGFQVLP